MLCGGADGDFCNLTIDIKRSIFQGVIRNCKIEASRKIVLLGLRDVILVQEISKGFARVCFGMEGLERFIQREPLRRIPECVFGVLALESQPVDPRL